MKRFNHAHFNRLDSSEVVDALEARLVACGLGEHIETWPVNPAFASDPFFRIYLPVEGSFRILSPDEEQEVSPGKLCLIPALTPLKYQAVSPSRHYWVHFFSRHLEKILLSGRMYEVRCRSIARYERIFQQLIQAVSGERDSIRTAMKLRHLLDMLLIPFLEATPQAAARAVSTDERVRRTIDYIEKHLNEPIRLDTLLKLANMSESDFRRQFHRQQGVSPKSYIVSRRLSAARLLLMRTDRSIAEVAEECGYGSAYFFCRQFKHYFAHSPSEFRRIHRGIFSPVDMFPLCPECP
ncbi:helix-turn-helix transcriptional regulator [Victivallis vadensis]|uniref:Helix-turn-helix transcriptional regulator n=1 Tax=Victivallis vadensis TaxID=172901 RepID=A0A848B0E2_9BACT|nr:helix-turn-helix transcriptional regulator [Victivallis vadensis]